MSIRSAAAAGCGGNGGGTTDAAVGMMDGAYFTSRKDILDFFNTLLSLNLTKIEQTASGAVACQLVEYMYPNSVPLRRVNWEAKTEYEYVNNYKLLQAAFDRHRIRKHVDVDRLVRAKYQDNLEFCQWLKAFYDQAAPYPDRGGYDPVAARSRGKGGKDANRRFQKTAAQHGSKLLPTDRGSAAATPAGGGARGRTTPSSGRSVATMCKSSSKPPGSNAGAGGRARSTTAKENLARNSASSASKPPPGRRKAADNGATVKSSSSSSSPPRSSSDHHHRSIVADANLMKKNSDLAARNAELELTVADLERERDFYFEKLRDVEVMLQIHADKKEAGRGDGDSSVVMGRIMKILYATSDDPVTVDDDGELVGDGGDDAAGGEEPAAKRDRVEVRRLQAAVEEDLVMNEVEAEADHGPGAAAAALAATDIVGEDDDDSDDDLLVDDDVLRAGGGGGDGGAMDESLVDIY